MDLKLELSSQFAYVGARACNSTGHEAITLEASHYDVSIDSLLS